MQVAAGRIKFGLQELWHRRATGYEIDLLMQLTPNDANLKGSPLRSALSSAIIKLNEEGLIMQLKEKWWKKERGGGACQVFNFAQILCKYV